MWADVYRWLVVILLIYIAVFLTCVGLVNTERNRNLHRRLNSICPPLPVEHWEISRPPN